jgi:threonine aldolase
MVSNFASDNVSGASPEIITALLAASECQAMPYGADEWTLRLEKEFTTLFETDVLVFPVVTGTAANALALAALTPPHGAIYCHQHSHAHIDECGAPEFYSGGAKMIGINGPEGKIEINSLSSLLENSRPHGVHNVRPTTLTLSQATESGTIYSVDELKVLTELAHYNSMMVHMDGARFANALVQQNISPADATWKCGVDVLSFGATKNGALAAEAVIFFTTKIAEEFGESRKRGGHLLSKMRFVSAQLDAYISNDLWLSNARIANNAAQRLSDGLSKISSSRLVNPTEANEVFIELPEKMIKDLENDGFGFYRMKKSNVIRLVTSFNTRDSEVDEFIKAVRKYNTKT